MFSDDFLDEDEKGMMSVEKTGPILTFSSDPDPSTDSYQAIGAPGGVLILLPDSERRTLNDPTMNNELHEPQTRKNRDREARLRRAFEALQPLIGKSAWTNSPTPLKDLAQGFVDLATQPDTAKAIDDYLTRVPQVRHSVEMLFTTLAMSARAKWRDTPANIRAIAARGWFLGRWLPTFLVIDGPLKRFLASEAFRRQNPPVEILRCVRRFLQEPTFIQLRHAIAHWSFEWRVCDDDSVLVLHGRPNGAVGEVIVSREQADAFHIVTFAIAEGVNDAFLRQERD